MGFYIEKKLKPTDSSHFATQSTEIGVPRVLYLTEVCVARNAVCCIEKDVKVSWLAYSATSQLNGWPKGPDSAPC